MLDADFIHRDRYGIIGQVQPAGSPIEVEGGDSVNWTGHYIYLTGKGDLKQFRAHQGGKMVDGAYVRHPVHSSTFNEFGAYYQGTWDGVISRDQYTGILLGLLKLGCTKCAKKAVKHHAKRGFLFAYNTRINGQNPWQSKWKMPDFTGPDIWALEIRALRLPDAVALPLLTVLDLHVLVNSLTLRMSKKDDVISHVGKLVASLEYQPTVTSKLTWKLTNRLDLVDRLFTYWTGWRQQYGMYKLYYKKLTGL